MAPRLALTSLAAIAALSAGTAEAQFVDLQDIADLSDAQSQFDDLSADLGAAFGYHSLMPAGARDTLNLPFALEVGAAAVVSPVSSADDINDGLSASADMADLPGHVVVPSLRANASFPYDISVGAGFAQVPGTDVTHLGGELRWSIYDFPGPGVVGVRGTASTVNGIDELSLTTLGGEAVVSANLGLAEPYGHAGLQQVSSDPDIAGLDSVSTTQTKIGAGVRVGVLPFLNVTGEINSLGGRTTYALRAAAGL